MWSPLRWRIGPPLSSSGVASAVITPVPARAPYSVPYGPHFSRPSGRVIVPFGSSQYYYHR